VAQMFLWAACPSCHPTNSVKAPKETQSTVPNQWSGLIFSSSTTQLVTDRHRSFYAGFLMPAPQMNKL